MIRRIHIRSHVAIRVVQNETGFAIFGNARKRRSILGRLIIAILLAVGGYIIALK